MKKLKLFILISTFVVTSADLQAQGCLDNIEDASRAYYNGRFEEVISLLDCDLSEFDKKDQTDILELLIKSNLLLENNEPADQYMAKLLTINPLYQPRTSDILLFKELHQSYELQNRRNFGLVIGLNIPSFEILRYQSIGSLTQEPANYESTAGFILGLKGEFRLIDNLFINTGILYQNFTYNYSEVILEYQQLDVNETMHILDVPLNLRYEMRLGSFIPFVNAGMSAHFLLRSNMGLDLRTIPTEVPVPYAGIPQKTDSYNNTPQRKPITLNYLLGAGVRKSIGTYQLEVAVNYQYGINNLIDPEARYSDNELLDTYAYVPDDIKLNSLMFSAGVYKSILIPKKK